MNRVYTGFIRLAFVEGGEKGCSRKQGRRAWGEKLTAYEEKKTGREQRPLKLQTINNGETQKKQIREGKNQL